MFMIPLTSGRCERDLGRIGRCIVGGKWEAWGWHSAARGGKFGSGDRVESGQGGTDRHLLIRDGM